MTRAPLFKVPTGSRLVLDGRPWRVTGRDKDGYAVEGIDDGECITLACSRVDEAIQAGTCEVTKPVGEEKRKALIEFTGGYERVEQLPDEQQSVVRARLFPVLAILQLEEEGIKLTHRAMSRNRETGADGPVRKMLKRRAREIAEGDKVLGAKRGGRITPSFDWPEGRTLRKYADLFLKFDRNPVVLLDRDHMKGPQGAARQRLSPLQEQYISYVINLWQSVTKPRLAPLLRGAQSQFHLPPEELARGFCFPSITTVRNRIKALSAVVTTLGREGPRHGANLKGAGSTDIRALMYGEKWEKDEAYLSIFTDGKGAIFAKEIDHSKEGKELEENEIARLWMHFVIDIATRLPLAWVISDSADSDHSQALLRMATRDKTKEKMRYDCQRDPAPAAGLMLSSADNGSATRNAQIYAAQSGIGGITMTGRTYHATDKPYVERAFGTFQWQALNFLPGYTGSRPGELSGYDPMANVAATHDQLYGMITRYFVDEYAFAPHRGTGMHGATPWQKFEEVRDAYGGIEPPDRITRSIHLGIKREMHTTSEGVNPFNIPYNSTALQRYAAGASKPVTVHIDPDFPRQVYITARGHSEIIEAELRMTAFNDLTLEEIIDLMEATAKENQQSGRCTIRIISEPWRGDPVNQASSRTPALRPATGRLSISRNRPTASHRSKFDLLRCSARRPRRAVSWTDRDESPPIRSDHPQNPPLLPRRNLPKKRPISPQSRTASYDRKRIHHSRRRGPEREPATPELSAEPRQGSAEILCPRV